MAAQLATRIDRLLNGENVAADWLERYQLQKRHFERMLANCIKDDLFILSAMRQVEIPRAETVARTEPKQLKLSALWKCSEVAAPGNILVVPQDDRPQILVIDGGKQVAVLSTEGKVVATHPLGDEKQPIRFLRTAVDGAGKRYFVGAASPAQQLLLFDDQFQRKLVYPPNVQQNPHTGIADVRLADLAGDGQLEILVGYWNVVGVQGVSLDGNRLWANRSVTDALRMSVYRNGPDKPQTLLTLNSHGGLIGTITELDASGKRVGQITIPELSLAWVATADLDGDGRSEICALALDDQRNFAALGLTNEGQVAWRYTLPRGVHEHPIEAVTSGRLLPQGPGQWLIASADSTIHFINRDGTLLDKFAYGQPLTGLAATQWDGKHILLVATAKSVEAWEVQVPSQK